MSTNKKEFIALIKKYESITLETINKYKISGSIFFTIGSFTAFQLTGFGSNLTCTLCKATNTDCGSCYWYEKTSTICTSHKTYQDIKNAKDEISLLKAFKARAKYMRQQLTIWEKLKMRLNF